MEKVAANRAFTLIELLVVVSVIAMLAALLLPALSSARDAALTAACTSNQRQIMLALAIYQGENGDFVPPSKMPGPAFLAASGGPGPDSVGFNTVSKWFTALLDERNSLDRLFQYNINEGHGYNGGGGMLKAYVPKVMVCPATICRENVDDAGRVTRVPHYGAMPNHGWIFNDSALSKQGKHWNATYFKPENLKWARGCAVDGITYRFPLSGIPLLADEQDQSSEITSPAGHSDYRKYGLLPGANTRHCAQGHTRYPRYRGPNVTNTEHGLIGRHNRNRVNVMSTFGGNVIVHDMLRDVLQPITS